ncbi:CAP domain-containing protein [Arthrobacter sp. ISL-72]|uniref:CAP domain-containing protein n=1 Tax=Arthrobacter sp. ISL-72 TaxID=2819114 RepID=UPI00288C41EB|nr:CAP domain-containing protein [Arthrobacter sp. ISL-72]
MTVLLLKMEAIPADLGFGLGKISAGALAVMICTAVLIPPAAGQLGGSSSSPESSASSVAGQHPQSATGPLSEYYGSEHDGGTEAAAAAPGSPRSPGDHPAVLPGSPGASAAALPDTSAAAPPATAADVDPAVPGPAGTVAKGPEPASIPPLSATASELAALLDASGQTLQTHPGPGALQTDHLQTNALRTDASTTQALVTDDASSQIKTVFNAINSYRASFGLPAVKYHATVASMAQEWSDSIASREVLEHRSSFWTDPRALSPTNGAGEVIAVRWDRDAAQLVEWWKSSPAHNALLKDPRFNVMGIGITFTDGNWQTTPGRYTMWGVVNFFG